MEASERRRLAAAATERIKQFLELNTIEFNGAGEPNLPSVEQAWCIDHTDEAQRLANRATIRGIAKILKEFRAIRCKVHGETGAARSAPLPLALFLGMREVEDVNEIMDILAQARAQACLDALVASGVPPNQLLLSFNGMGGHIRVDFIPEGELPTESDLQAAPPLPDEPWLHRDYRRTTLQQWGPRHVPPRQSKLLRNQPVPWAKVRRTA